MSWAVGLPDVVAEQARLRPSACAAVCGTERLSYADLARRVGGLAGVLVAHGVARGDRVVWLGRNCHRLLELVLAAAHVGASVCPVNWRLQAAELRFELDDLAPSLVVDQAGPDLRDRWAAVARGGRVLDGVAAYEEAVAAAAAPPVTGGPDDDALALYTGSVGGRPAAALLPQQALVAHSVVLGLVRGVSPATVYLDCGPMFHVGTLMMTLATLRFGGTNVFTPRADPRAVCELVAAERCTSAFLVEPTISEVAALAVAGGYDLRSLRWAATGTPFDELVTVDDALGGGSYGQTEVSGLLSMQRGEIRSAGHHGWPVPSCAVAVLDPEDRPLVAGEAGEIAARGPTVMSGYHARPAANAERFRSGWYHTGDLGRIEADGSLTFLGPRGRLVKTGNENVYPSEVEDCIRRHPLVAECAVIGIPDERWGQSVAAIVVPAADGLTAREVVAHCRANLASYKKPRAVELVARLPRRDGGIDYAAVDERFGGGGYPGSGSGHAP